ncbi:MAG TPA: hypothetical protein VJ779_04150 [Acetobacteraceae bacterium]|nr:hypothetical protein [Acetobacteraceae bacterium]
MSRNAKSENAAAQRAPVKTSSERVVEWQALDRRGRLKGIGGSPDDRFNSQVANAALATAWFPKNMTSEDRDKLVSAVVNGMMAFKPADEIEGMLAAQAVAMHHAAMECARRAMIPEQPFEVAQGCRKAAANASRTFTELLAALDRKRGKGTKQVVRVERVTVQPGGQAVVGVVAPGMAAEGAGHAAKTEEQAHAPPAGLAHDAALGPVLPPLRSADPERECVPVAGNGERPMPDARWQEHRPANS